VEPSRKSEVGFHSSGTFTNGAAKANEPSARKINPE
jgi:hypothetical protein